MDQAVAEAGDLPHLFFSFVNSKNVLLHIHFHGYNKTINTLLYLKPVIHAEQLYSTFFMLLSAPYLLLLRWDTSMSVCTVR